MTLITQHCQAYVNHGRWVAECPRPYCGNAIRLDPNQPVFQCLGEGGCQMVAYIEWPDDPQGIWDALSRRPVPSTRNWLPEGHDWGQIGYPCGQTPKELIDEQEEMERISEVERYT